MRALTWVVVHTCGAFDAKNHRVVHQSVETVRAYHKLAKALGGNGWSDIGYHRYVEQNGVIRMGRGDATVGAHASGFNAFSLGICCSGHGDHEPFNPAQMTALVAQVVAWCKLYAIAPDHVIGHRETSQFGGPPVTKSCPGNLVDMLAIRLQVRDELAGGAARKTGPTV